MIGFAVAAAIAGLAVRVWHIARDPFWLDEAYSAFAADRSFAFLWRVVPLYETHPPFYYTLLKLWSLVFGDGLVALRALGLAAGMLVPPAIGWAALAAGRLLGWSPGRRRRAAVAGFALACVAIAPVEMSREVRPYPLMILVYALGLRALLALAARAAGGRPLAGAALAGYLLATELMLWLHNLGPLWGAAMTLALATLIAGRRIAARDWLWIGGGYALVAAAYLPCLLILLNQAPTWIASTWVRFSAAEMWDRLAVLYAAPGGWAAVAGLLALMAAATLAQGEAEGRRLLAVLLILALVPTILSVALTLAIAPVFITRTLTPVAVPTLLLLGAGAAAEGRLTRILGPGAVLILGMVLLGADVQARRGGPMQDWYGTVAWLEKRFRPGDAIYAYPNEGALPLARALRDRGLSYPIRQIPADMPALRSGGWNPTGSRGVVSIPRERLHAIAREPATRSLPTLWLLRLGANAYDVGDVAAQEFAWRRHRVRRWRAGPIDIIGLRRDDLPRDLAFYSGAASASAVSRK